MQRKYYFITIASRDFLFVVCAANRMPQWICSLFYSHSTNRKTTVPQLSSLSDACKMLKHKLRLVKYQHLNAFYAGRQHIFDDSFILLSYAGWLVIMKDLWNGLQGCKRTLQIGKDVLFISLFSYHRYFFQADSLACSLWYA